MEDAWKHRSENMKCNTCMWFLPKDESIVGRCRRHAPTLNGWPVVFGPNDWCGDHKLDAVNFPTVSKTFDSAYQAYKETDL